MQSALLSLENNLLQYNIKQNLLSEKTAKILEISKALICFHEFQPKVPFESFQKSQFGISMSTKNFEQKIRQDLELLSNSQKIVLRQQSIKEKMDSILEKMVQNKNIQDSQENDEELKQYAECSVKNLNYLQSNLRILVENEIRCMNDFLAETQRSLRGLTLIRKCFLDLENGKLSYLSLVSS
jgi:hypothetical protein